MTWTGITLVMALSPQVSMAVTKSKSAAKKPVVAAVAGAASAKLKSLSARFPVNGWDAIGAVEWPGVGDAVIARAKADWIDVFRDRFDFNTSLRLIKGRSVAGPVALMAVGAAGDFVRVAIPLRPNGTLGWVRRTDVNLVRSALHVEVDLSTNSLTVFDGKRSVIQTSVAAGTGGTPTPRGLFFLKELVPQSPGGALGPFAFGLSGFSNVLTSYGGGEGVIGIHGTNSPGKLGSNVSHGCVRVDNATITKMAKLLPLGTPVEIIESAKSTRPSRASSAWLDTFLAEANGTVLPAQESPLLSATDTTPQPSAQRPAALALAPEIDPTSKESAPVVDRTVSTTTTTKPAGDDLLGAVGVK